MTWKRLKNQIWNVIGNPYNMIVFISLVLLICLIVLPLISMVKNTFILAASEVRRVRGGHAGDMTLYYWKYLLTGKLASANFWQPLVHSLLIAFL